METLFTTYRCSFAVLAAREALPVLLLQCRCMASWAVLGVAFDLWMLAGCRIAEGARFRLCMTAICRGPGGKATKGGGCACLCLL